MIAKLCAAIAPVRAELPQFNLENMRAAPGHFFTIRYSTPTTAAVVPALIVAAFAPNLPSAPASNGFNSLIPYELATSMPCVATNGNRLRFQERIAAICCSETYPCVVSRGVFRTSVSTLNNSARPNAGAAALSANIAGMLSKITARSLVFIR